MTDDTQILDFVPSMEFGDQQADSLWTFELIWNMGCMSLLWGAVGFAYYGLTLSAGMLSRHLCVNLVLLGIIEIPAYLMNMVLLECMPRRTAALRIAALQTLCIGINLTISLWGSETTIRRLTVPLAMCSKALCSISFGCIWVWAPEIYPAQLRTVGVAVNSQCARAASMIAPILLAHLQQPHGDWSAHSQVMLLLTGTSVVCLPLVFLLPNSKILANNEKVKGELEHGDYNIMPHTAEELYDMPSNDHNPAELHQSVRT